MNKDQLSRIVRWEAVPDFPDQCSVIQEIIHPILESIRKHSVYTVKVFESGCYSNYFAFLVCHSSELVDRPNEVYWKVPTVVCNMSLYAPVAVLGRAVTSYGTVFCNIQHLDLEDLIDPGETNDDITKVVVEAVSSSPYNLLSVEEAALPSPQDIEWREDSYTRSSSNSVFSALFLCSMD